MTFLLKIWFEPMNQESAEFFKIWMKRLTLKQSQYLRKLANEPLGKKEKKMKFEF